MLLILYQNQKYQNQRALIKLKQAREALIKPQNIKIEDKQLSIQSQHIN